MVKYIVINILTPAALLVLLSCDFNEGPIGIRKIYVANQGQDHVSVLNGETGELIRVVEVNFIENFNNDAPHFISLDEVNNYWFVTLMQSGYLAMFDLMTDTLIDSIYLGDMPALSTIDPTEKVIYISRMNMPGIGMSSASNLIQAVSYSGGTLAITEEFNICPECDDGIGPHGITLHTSGDELFVTSVLSDFLFQVDVLSGTIINQMSLNGDDGAAPSTTIQRMKPIQCVAVDEFIFISCSAGDWVNGDEFIPGQIHMVNAETLELIDTFDGFSGDSRPWHLIADPENSKLYVALSGDMIMPVGQGVSCFSYNLTGLNLLWHLEDVDEMDDPHGAAISGDGNTVYISDRGNGHLFSFDSQSAELLFDLNLSISSIGSSTTLGGVAVMQSGCTDCE